MKELELEPRVASYTTTSGLGESCMVRVWGEGFLSIGSHGSPLPTGELFEGGMRQGTLLGVVLIILDETRQPEVSNLAYQPLSH